jgi:hypothetical protein
VKSSTTTGALPAMAGWIAATAHNYEDLVARVVGFVETVLAGVRAHGRTWDAFLGQIGTRDTVTGG